MRSGVFGLAALVTTACGAVAEPTPTPPYDCRETDACDQPHQNDDVALPSSSSKLLVFDTVSRSDGKGDGSSLPLPSTRASIGNKARLDITKVEELPRSEQLTITIAPRWGEVTKVDIVLPTTASPKTLGLVGTMLFSVLGEQNEWSSITLDLDDKGQLAGTFTAVGTLDAFAGDEVETYPITGAGHLADDGLAPEMRLLPPLRSHGDKYLPWDSLVVQLSEPLPPSDIQSSLTYSTPGISWSPGTANGQGWTTALSGKTADLDINGQSATLRSPSASVEDPSQNTLVPFSASVAFQSLGVTVERHDLDDGLTGATWGGVDYVQDARCEKGGCVVFPTASANECAIAPGFAGRLRASTQIHALHARVKVLAADAYGSTTDAPLLYQPIRLEVSNSRGTMFTGSPPTFDTLTRTAEDTDLPWASAWQTIDVPITEIETNIGFAFVRSVCDSLGGLPLPTSSVSVRIDDVWVD